MSFIFKRSAIAAAALLSLSATGALHAQSSPPSPSNAPTLKEVTVTGNPLGSAERIAPVQSLSGSGLLLRSQGTLGETLNGMPGVSSTYFGPNASRPIVRGQDGDRIRILSNGGASLDASGLSFDHAVPGDVSNADRIEVLRGPGALIYGGSAIGGVVNVMDGRIPRERLFDAKGGVAGKADFGLSSGKNGAFMVETGNANYALHFDAFARSSGDVAVPIDLACSKPGSPALARRICNSAASSQGAAVGGSLLFDQGYLGASFTGYGSNYGTVAEDDVTIQMRSRRVALEGEKRGLQSATGGLLQSVKAQFSNTDYKHTEFEGPTPGTVFTNKGNDLRIEARHVTFGKLDGIWGLQTESTRFAADGAEAFAPLSKSNSTALFAYEELATGWGKLSFGGRVERVSVQSLGNPLLPKFVPGSRNFSLGSYAVGALLNLTADKRWQLTSNLALSQRAPKDYELYADGPHLATASYEVGDSTLAKEKSTNIDVGVQWAHGANRFALSAFVSRFKNYIYLDNTGNQRNADDGELNPVEDVLNNPGFTVSNGTPFGPLPEQVYRQVRARFSGLEASGNLRLIDTGHPLDLELRGDLVRAQNTSVGQPLPRIAPMRLGATLVYTAGPWGARLGVDHNARQTRVPTGQAETAGYSLWNAALTYRSKLAGPSGGQITWFAKVDNLTDKLAYSATSVLTQTVPGKSPLPGRAIKLGMQASF